MDDDALDEAHESVSCNMCGGQEDEEVLLMCDHEGCPNATHTFCCRPALLNVPDGTWYCVTCNPLERAKNTSEPCPQESEARPSVNLGRVLPPFGDTWAPRPPTNTQADAWAPRPKRGTFKKCGACQNCENPGWKQRCLAPILLTSQDMALAEENGKRKKKQVHFQDPVTALAAEEPYEVPESRRQNGAAILRANAASFLPSKTKRTGVSATPEIPDAELVVDSTVRRSERKRSGTADQAQILATSSNVTGTDIIHQWIPIEWTSPAWFASKMPVVTDHTMATWVRQAMPGHYTPTHVNRVAKDLREIRTAVDAMRSSSPSPGLIPQHTKIDPCTPYPVSDGWERTPETKRRSKMPLGLETIVTMPSEVRTLLQFVDLTNITGIYDLWSGTRTIEMVLYQHSVKVHSSDFNPKSPAGHADAMDVATYSGYKQRPEGLKVIISSPDFRLVDIAVALAVQAVELFACIHVPGDYLSNAHPARLQFFMHLRAKKRIILIQNLPKGPIGRSCQWIVIFQKMIDPRRFLVGKVLALYVENTDQEGELQYRGQVWADTPSSPTPRRNHAGKEQYMTRSSCAT